MIFAVVCWGALTKLVKEVSSIVGTELGGRGILSLSLSRQAQQHFALVYVRELVHVEDDGE